MSMLWNSIRALIASINETAVETQFNISNANNVVVIVEGQTCIPRKIYTLRRRHERHINRKGTSSDISSRRVWFSATSL